ncbi:hypothetical protein [Vibrio sp. M60_M70]|uniref:hypothetical protein n=1 Tax=Vibrio sp. M60_M70 TaxID=3035166 RepID=UPI00301DA338
MNVTDQLDPIDINSAQSLLKALEGKGLRDIDISKRCNCSPSRITAWKKGGGANEEYLIKLRALLNERLSNHHAFVHNVVSKVSLPLDKDHLESFLMSVVTNIGEDDSVVRTLEHRQQLLDASCLDDINRLLSESFNQKVRKEVDLSVAMDRSRPAPFGAVPNYVKPTKVLPFDYQRQMQSLIAALLESIENAESRLKMLEKRKEADKETIYSSFQSVINQMKYHNHSYGEEEQGQQLEEKLNWLVEQLQPSQFTSANSYNALVNYMERVAAFMEDCEFGARHNVLALGDRNSYIPECITRSNHVLSSDDLGFAIDEAKKLLAKFERFSDEQKRYYEKLFELKSREVGRENKLNLNKIFDVSKAVDISEGKTITVNDFLSLDIDNLLQEVLKQDKIELLIFDNDVSINLAEKLKGWCRTMEATPICQTVQINGELVYQSSEGASSPITIYALDNNDLILLRKMELCEKQVMVMEPPLSATELLDIVERDHKYHVKEALLTRGYLLSDVLTIS